MNVETLPVAASALSYLSSGVSVELVGRPASGRTTAVRQVAERLAARGVPVVQVTGVGALRDYPLAALCTSLPDLRRQPTMADAHAHLADATGRGGVLLVDDVDDLDPATLGVVAALRAHGQVPTLVAHRMGPRPTSSLRALLAALTPCVRVSIPPLRYGELQALLHHDVGGVFDSKTMARVATKSGGLPGVAKAIVKMGQRSGVLTHDGSVWTAHGSLWSPELAQTVEACLVDADDEDLDALALLAAAGTVSVTDARRLVDPERLEVLSRRGYLDYIDGPSGGSVGLYPPLIIEYLVREATASSLVQVRERLVAEGMALPPEFVVGLHPPQPWDEMLRSRTVEEHWVSLAHQRLAAWRADPVPGTAAPLMVALCTSAARVVDPNEVYVGTDLSRGSEAENAELACWFAVYRAVILGDRAGAGFVLDAAERQSPSARGFVLAVRMHLRMMVGRLPGEVPEPEPGELPVSATALRVARLEAALARGDVDAARAVIASDGSDHPVLTAQSHVLGTLTDVLAGDLEGGIGRALAGRDAAQVDRLPGAIHAHSYVAALGLAIQGRLDEADRVVSAALTMTSVAATQAHFYSGLLGLSAARSRWLSDDVAPGDLPEQAAPFRSGPFPYMAGCLHGLRGGDAASVWQRVGSVAESGYATATAFLCVDAAELAPDGGALAFVTATLPRSGSAFLRTLLTLAHGIATRDLDVLRSTDDELARTGALLFLARSGVQQALVLRERGDAVAAAQQAARTWAAVLPVGGQVRGVFAPLRAHVGLSPREHEVVRLVLSGQTPAEIAAALVLSVRTVEHHLSHAYRKIGIDSRGLLVEAFGTWLAG